MGIDTYYRVNKLGQPEFVRKKKDRRGKKVEGTISELNYLSDRLLKLLENIDFVQTPSMMVDQSLDGRFIPQYIGSSTDIPLSHGEHITDVDFDTSSDGPENLRALYPIGTVMSGNKPSDKYIENPERNDADSNTTHTESHLRTESFTGTGDIAFAQYNIISADEDEENSEAENHMPNPIVEWEPEFAGGDYDSGDYEMPSPQGKGVAKRKLTQSDVGSMDTDTTKHGHAWPRKHNDTPAMCDVDEDGVEHEPQGTYESSHGDASDGITSDVGHDWPDDPSNDGGGVAEPLDGSRWSDGGVLAGSSSGSDTSEAPVSEWSPERIGALLGEEHDLQRLFDNYARSNELVCVEDFQNLCDAHGIGVDLDHRSLMHLMGENREYMFYEHADSDGQYWLATPFSEAKGKPAFLKNKKSNIPPGKRDKKPKNKAKKPFNENIGMSPRGGDMFKYIDNYTVTFTTDADLDVGETRTATPQEVINYLNADPRHAIVLHDIEEESGECVATTPQYIIRGAGEQLGDFYFGAMPAEDPNDAEGIDLTAEEALFQATDALCGGGSFNLNEGVISEVQVRSPEEEAGMYTQHHDSDYIDYKDPETHVDHASDNQFLDNMTMDGECPSCGYQGADDMCPECGTQMEVPLDDDFAAYDDSPPDEVSDDVRLTDDDQYEYGPLVDEPPQTVNSPHVAESLKRFLRSATSIIENSRGNRKIDIAESLNLAWAYHAGDVDLKSIPSKPRKTVFELAKRYPGFSPLSENAIDPPDGTAIGGGGVTNSNFMPKVPGPQDMKEHGSAKNMLSHTQKNNLDGSPVIKNTSKGMDGKGKAYPVKEDSSATKIVKHNINKLSKYVQTHLSEHKIKGCSSVTYNVAVVEGKKKNRTKARTRLSEALVDAEEILQLHDPKDVSLEANYYNATGGVLLKSDVPLFTISPRGPLMAEGKAIFRFKKNAERFTDELVAEGAVCVISNHNWGAAVDTKAPLSTMKRAFRLMVE